MKLVKYNSEPLDPTSELMKIKELVASANLKKKKEAWRFIEGKMHGIIMLKKLQVL